MKKELFNYIACIIRDYPETDKKIAETEQELMFRFNDLHDENVGGGRAQYVNNEGVANMAITLAENNRINNLRRNADVVGKCLDECDEDTFEIINALYLHKHPEYTLDGIAQKIHISRAQAYRKRTSFFEEVAEKRGL